MRDRREQTSLTYVPDSAPHMQRTILLTEVRRGDEASEPILPLPPYDSKVMPQATIPHTSYVQIYLRPPRPVILTTPPEPEAHRTPATFPTVQIPRGDNNYSKHASGFPLLEPVPYSWDTTKPRTAFWCLLSQDSGQSNPSTGGLYSGPLDSSIRLQLSTSHPCTALSSFILSVAAYSFTYEPHNLQQTPALLLQSYLLSATWDYTSHDHLATSPLPYNPTLTSQLPTTRAYILSPCPERP